MKAGIDAWTGASGITAGVLLRSINKAGKIWGTRFSRKVIRGVVKLEARSFEIPSLAPHDLRRTYARLCHQAGGEPEQIQFLLGALRSPKLVLEYRTQVSVSPARPKSNPTGAERTL